jgi:hypothetical protein
MYLSSQIVVEAIKALKQRVHPFLGITFLACKAYDLKIGAAEDLSLDALTRDHLDEYHLLDRRSRCYFQPFRSPAFWVDARYPSTGLQTINTQTFKDVFLHPRNTSKWGFVDDYIGELKQKLKQINRHSTFPIDALAVWIYKGHPLELIDSTEGLIDKFVKDFHLSEEEQRELFCERQLSGPKLYSVYSDEPLIISDVVKEFPPPPDAQSEGGSTLASLRLVNAGPAANLAITFGERLSLITGDNGLGKSFLLDFAWWAATGNWADRPILPPLENPRAVAKVEYSFRSVSGRLLSEEANFDSSVFTWRRPNKSVKSEALALFSRTDGSFSVSDPFRAKFPTHTGWSILSGPDVWNGKAGVIEGLIRDWVRWQFADRIAFDRFIAVLKRLSPEDLGTLAPGNPVRLPGDPREIPTVQHRYGTVPVTQASSGVQRILLLAYLIIWSWHEHEIAASQLAQSPLRRMLVIVDEPEAHLHPKWQRIVLPALMDVAGFLSGDLSLQMISATHSPMILASMETYFNTDTDVLYHLFGEGSEVRLEETPFVKYGDISGWLTSPVFGLRHARSREAERAIEDAKALQEQESPDTTSVSEVSGRLKQHLADDDQFWPRWLYFADQHGVSL